MVLEKMKAYSENEKQQLIKRKEEITMELETHKFADMKDQERLVHEQSASFGTYSLSYLILLGKFIPRDVKSVPHCTSKNWKST